ncbi:uncharacterized protein LOC119792417 [Cyprinodon tularosa]|uniref:uncharacterized protein LOC119792417 n=1 Tax=Cyprinodon tularosa TaxID=77115 RepID=UPI0018E219DF|nr:uncharacterized protein LOC119792417 [Cyprinodon tularosa]
MLLSLVLLWLLVGGSQASHFLGTVMTYYPKETLANGSISVILRYKLNFARCKHSDTWECSGNCGIETQTLALSVVEEETMLDSSWCQREGEITHLLPNNTGFQTVLAGSGWVTNTQNGVSFWLAVTDVELRNRSDIEKPNSSPQSTILPALRFPSNCAKNINFLAFDPDGDEVKCRYGSTSDSECNPCTPPSVLSLSSSCSLSFSPTNSTLNSSTELLYAVQLVMEDFPTQSITLTQTDGSQEVKTTTDAISKIPLQFVLRVGPTIPSCTEGLYLPRFLFSTPENRAQLFSTVGQVLEISIRAEANMSVITNLLYSGPYNVVKRSLGSGSFSLSWTPSATEVGQNHPICFTVQANVSNTFYDSELRCVIVTVGNAPSLSTAGPTSSVPLSTESSTELNTTTPSTVNATANSTTLISTRNATTSITLALNTTTSTNATQIISTLAGTTSDPGPGYVIALNMKISTTLSLKDDSDTIIALIKEKLVQEGLPSSITIRPLNTTASP